MAPDLPYPLPRQRNLIPVSLLVLAALAWALLLWQTAHADTAMLGLTSRAAIDRERERRLRRSGQPDGDRFPVCDLLLRASPRSIECHGK